MLSYKQIISKFKEFAQNHYILESYGTGEAFQIVEHNKQKTRKYPMMWVEDQPFPFGNKSVTYSFRVYFLQQVPTLKKTDSETLEQANVVEAKSDMLQCAQDLMSFWVQDHNYPALDIIKSTLGTPFHDILMDNLTGFYIDIKLEQGFSYNSCAIPMSGVTPPPSEDVSLTVNGDSFIDLPCGSDYNLPVKDTNGLSVGVKVGAEWIVPATGGGLPASNQVNGAAKTDIPAGGSKDFVIQDAGGSPIVVTQISDSATEFIGSIPAADPVVNSMNAAPLIDAASGTTKAFTIRYADDSAVVVTTILDSATAFIGEVPDNTPPITTIAYHRANWTAKNTLYNTHDLGWYLANESSVFDYAVVGLSPLLDITDKTKLTTLNAFGNLDRITNSLGLTATYDGSNGETADYAIDHYTGMGWYLQDAVAVNIDFVDASVNLRAATLATYSDWRTLTVMDIAEIVTDDGAGSPSTLFDGIESWSKDLTWIMNSIGTGTGLFWRLNQHIVSSQWMNNRAINSASSSIMTIGIRKHY
tara:strand:- start:662 stop:2245 length:1584 start_codon:yes stop_codon:yes gene_type:complete